MTAPESHEAGLGRLLLRDAVLYGLGHVIARSTYLVLVPVLTRALLPPDLGSVDLLMAATAVATSVVSLEINQGLARYIPSADASARQEMASSALRFAIVTFGGIGLLLVILAEPVGDLILGSPGQALLVQSAALYAVATGIFLVAHGQLRWEMRAAAFALVAIVVAFTSLAAVVLLVGVFRLGAVGVFIGNAIGAFAAMTLALWLARDSFRHRLSISVLSKLLRFSLPLVPATLAVYTTAYSDRFVLSRMLGNADVGLYAVGYRLASIVGIATVAFQLAITPLIFARFERPSTAGELASVFKGIVAGAALVWLGVTLFAPELVRTLATDAYAASSSIVPFLAAAILISGMTIFAPGLLIVGRTGMVAGLAVLIAVTALVLNVLLVPVLGIRGSAIAALMSALAGFAATVIAGQRHYRVPYRWFEMTLIIASVAAAWLIAEAADFDGWTRVPFRLVILLLVGAAFVAFDVVPRRFLLRVTSLPDFCRRRHR